VKEMGEIALALFYQRQWPGEKDEDGGRSDPEANVRKVLVKIREIFGLGPPDPEPEAEAAPASSQPQEGQQGLGATEAEEEGPPSGITSAQWEAREPVRQLLGHILSRQVEICEAQRKATLRESLMGPSPYERAAEIAPIQGNVSLMRRMQDSNFRQVWRVTNLLLKIKRQAREEETRKNPSRTLNVNEKTAA
jgi:hypothetical protein